MAKRKRRSKGLSARDQRRIHGFIYKSGFENFNPVIHAPDPKVEKRRREGIRNHRTRENVLEEVMAIHEADDLEDFEREEMFNEFVIEHLGFDLDEWVDLMMAEGYSEHDAYEMWFYP